MNPETKPFSDSIWTAELIRNYKGPIYRATLSWLSRATGSTIHSDLEAASPEALHATIRIAATNLRGIGSNPSVCFGPHTEATT